MPSRKRKKGVATSGQRGGTGQSAQIRQQRTAHLLPRGVPMFPGQGQAGTASSLAELKLFSESSWLHLPGLADPALPRGPRSSIHTHTPAQSHPSGPVHTVHLPAKPPLLPPPARPEQVFQSSDPGRGLWDSPRLAPLGVCPLLARTGGTSSRPVELLTHQGWLIPLNLNP